MRGGGGKRVKKHVNGGQTVEGGRGVEGGEKVKKGKTPDEGTSVSSRRRLVQLRGNLSQLERLALT